MYYDRWDIVDAYYWWFAHHYAGQNSNNYKRLCKIGEYYTPSILAEGPESLNVKEIYDSLCDKEDCKHERYMARYSW